MKKEYPEIQTLLELYKKHNVKISVPEYEYLAGNRDFRAVVFSLGKKSFNLFVDDEYQDFLVNNRLMWLCIVLRELEYYNDTTDYLLWCTELRFNPSNVQVLDYYRSLAGIYREVEQIIGKIKSPITDYEFEMNMGPTRELRQNYY